VDATMTRPRQGAQNPVLLFVQIVAVAAVRIGLLISRFGSAKFNNTLLGPYSFLGICLLIKSALLSDQSLLSLC
jgi:uncharacterized membrane protein YdcZ (DUF606 family)